MNEISLTDREQALVWGICAWFQAGKPKMVTGSLMTKLYPTDNYEIAKKFDIQIEDRIIELGKWLEERRATPPTNNLTQE